jgi:hypothetical protein
MHSMLADVMRWWKLAMAFIDDLFNKHRLIRRVSFVMAWIVMWIITDALIDKAETMNAYTAGSLRDIALAVFAVIGFYHYSRGKGQ